MSTCFFLVYTSHYDAFVCKFQGALVASRINTILGLALDFYSIQHTLDSGAAVSAIKARCEMEVDRIEKQFDDCIAFLLRVLFLSISCLFEKFVSTYSSCLCNYRWSQNI